MDRARGFCFEVKNNRRQVLKARRLLSAAGGAGFGGNGGEAARGGVGVALNGRGENEAGDGRAVGEKRLNEGFEVGHVEGGDLEEEVVAAGEVMALADLFEGGEEFEEAMVVGAGGSEADEGDDLEAEGFGIDACGVAKDNAGVLKLAKPLGGGGGGEADAARELGDGEAGVGLKFVEELSSTGVEVAG